MWLQVYQLSLNVKKNISLYFIFKKRNWYGTFKLLNNYQPIGKVNDANLLRVIIDKKLNWNDYINYADGNVFRAINWFISQN